MEAETTPMTPRPGSPSSRLCLSAAVIGLGVSAFLTQVTLMRELLAAFSGNELVFGVVLGNWMLLTGIGSALGRTASRWKSPLAVLVVAQVLVALLPVADVYLLRTLRNAIFLRGAEVGVTDAVVSCFVLLAPYCLVLGYLLPLASLAMSQAAGTGAGRGQTPSFIPSETAKTEGEAYGIGRVYFLDNVGSVLGGLLFSFLLVHLCRHFGILYGSAILNLLLAGLLAASPEGRRPACQRGRRLSSLVPWLPLATVLLATVSLLILAIRLDLDELTTGMQYPEQRVVEHRNSPYGRLIVTETAGQYNFIENGVVLFSTHNAEQVEETVHYAMAQRPDARRVLLVSGGVSGTAREVLKYDVEAVDYVELDPLVIEIARRWLPESLDDPRIRVISTDGRLYLKQTADRYDVVILDVPAPSTSQLNRFYTREFFAEVRRVLVPGGVVCFSLGQCEGRLSPDMARMLGTAHRTLREVYKNVLIVPGGRLFFLGSEGELTPAIAEQLQRSGIKTRVVSRSYLDAMRTKGREAEIRNALAEDAPVNRDFSPILYFYHLRYWTSQFQFRFGVLEAVLLSLLALFVVRLRGVPLAIFTTGFAASALEVVLLVGFQVLCGSVYYQVGLIVTMFMLGLGLGSLGMNWRLARKCGGTKCGARSLVWLLLALGVYSACVPVGLIGLGHVGGGLAVTMAQVAVPLLTLVVGVLVGLAFPLAAKLDTCPADVAATASRLYLADYVGAASGALIVSTLMIPLFGVVAVCLFTAGLCVASAAVLRITSKRG